MGENGQNIYKEIVERFEKSITRPQSSDLLNKIIGNTEYRDGYDSRAMPQSPRHVKYQNFCRWMADADRATVDEDFYNRWRHVEPTLWEG